MKIYLVIVGYHNKEHDKTYWYEPDCAYYTSDGAEEWITSTILTEEYFNTLKWDRKNIDREILFNSETKDGNWMIKIKPMKVKY